MTIALMTLMQDAQELGPKTMDLMAEQAARAKDLPTLAWLAPRVPLDSPAAAIIARQKSATVRAAWIGRDDLPDDQFTALLDGEKRVTVLRAAGVDVPSPAPTTPTTASEPTTSDSDLPGMSVPFDVLVTRYVSAIIAADHASVLELTRDFDLLCSLRPDWGKPSVAAVSTHATCEQLARLMGILSADGSQTSNRMANRVMRSWSPSTAADVLLKIPSGMTPVVQYIMETYPRFILRDTADRSDFTQELRSRGPVSRWLRDTLVDEVAGSGEWVPREWQVEFVQEMAPTSPAYLLPGPDRDGSGVEKEVMAAGFAAVLKAHPSLMTDSPSPAAQAWLNDARDLGRYLCFSRQSTTMLCLQLPAEAVDAAFGYQHAAVADVIVDVVAQVGRWPADRADSWWADLAKALAANPSDREVRAGFLPLVTHERFPWQELGSAATHWAAGLDRSDLEAWPARVLALMVRQDAGLATRMAADIEELLTKSGPSEVEMLTTLMADFPGTWRDLKDAVRML